MTLQGFTPIPPDFAARYRAKGYWRDETIGDELDRACIRFADRPAVVDAHQTLTYERLREQAHRLARHLLDLGVQPLDRIIVQLPNTVEFAIFYYASQKVGAIPLMALPAHRRYEIEHYASFTEAKVYVGPTATGRFSHAEMVAEMQRAGSPIEHVLLLGDGRLDGQLDLAELLAAEPTATDEDLANLRIDPDAPAVFQLSGGTTGVPKIIARTHNDYLFNARLSLEPYRIDQDDVLLACLPVEHNFPLACPGLQGYLLTGAKVVMASSPRPATCFALIEQHGVTHLPLVPAVLIQWLNDETFDRTDFGTVRLINTGGQRLQPETKRETERRLPGAAMCEMFGMAEGLLTFVLPDDAPDVRLETIGRPWCEDDEMILVDDAGEVVPDGEIGELICRGPYTLRGYFKADEHNARTFTEEGFFMTGDLMRRHPSGAFVVEGRKKDVVNRGGEKIGVEEVENFLLGHPSVQNVACVPMPDPVLGERMCAVVIPAPGATPTLDELVAHLLQQGLAKMKLPERLELVDRFPLSPFGKVSKKDLAASVAEHLADEQRRR